MFDPAGYLLDSKTWNKDLAVEIAARQSLTLTPEHWIVIDWLRAFYAEKERVPFMPEILKGNKIGLSGLFDLFPSGPVSGALRIAGLPRPSGCF